MPSLERRGELFVVLAPSGTGKTTLCRAVCRRLSGLVYSISYTTRLQRAGEVHGRDYFFVTEAAFQQMVDRGEFLEWAQVYGDRYGTSKDWLMARLDEGLDVILDVDVQGAEQLRKSSLTAHCIFVLPPSLDQLSERLRGRGTESVLEIEKRLMWALNELRRWETYDFVIVNDELEESVKDFEGVIRAQRCRTERKKLWIQQQMGQWIPCEKG